MRGMKKITKLFLMVLFAAGIIFISGNIGVKAVENEVTKDEIISAVDGYSLAAVINESEQRFAIKSKEISKVVIKSQKLASDSKSLSVKAVLYVNRKVATVKTTAKLKFTLKKDSWKLSSQKFSKASIYKIPIKGTWKGTVDWGKGDVAFTMKVKSVTKDGYITKGTATFGSTPTHKFESGSYTITGGLEKKTGKICFFGDEWISSPENGWYVDNFELFIDLEKEKLTGKVFWDSNNSNQEYNTAVFEKVK